MAKAEKMLPITPATVTINGSAWSARSTIWAGLRLHQAKHRATCHWTGAPESNLAVPWCPVDDWRDAKHDCIYTLRPKDERYRFKRARNRSWVLVMETNP